LRRFSQSDRNGQFSRDVLKEDFRLGLKELDGMHIIIPTSILTAYHRLLDAAAEQKNPDTFDPSVDLRDYTAIDLPVFTCSSRDYVRIKGKFCNACGSSSF